MNQKVFLIFSFIFFMCSINLVQAAKINNNPSFELFDTKKQEIIKQGTVTPFIKEEVNRIISTLTLYEKFNIDFDGVLLKVPLTPAIQGNPNISSEKIFEVILYQSNDKHLQLVILITKSSKTIVCTSNYSFDQFLKIVANSKNED